MSLSVEEVSRTMIARPSNYSRFEAIAALVRDIFPRRYGDPHTVNFGLNIPAMDALIELGAKRITHSYGDGGAFGGQSIDSAEIEIDGVLFGAQGDAYPTPGYAKELQSAMDEGFDGSPHQRAGYPRPSESGKLVQEYFEDQDRHKQHQSPIAPEHGGFGSEYDEAMEGGRR